MATRSLMALDYANHHTNNILKKHARNRALGDIEHRHAYVPSQPVLSCRTVQIDLPGTRTYRQRSTIDILDEQQRLIRQLYNKQRASTSAPPRQRAQTAPKPQEGHTRAKIEVKGRPLTSLSQGRWPQGNENIDPLPSKRRPKTTGRLKNIQPATDCFMVVKVDKDFLETSRNSRQLTDKIHSHWRSENHNLAAGKFVRGQKRPDDVPPTLDAWLTFGGAASDNSHGVIDAFATFKNSEEYYNIEGSIGSRVAQQLRKGDKIRIGINGVLMSQDLKVRQRTTTDGTTEQQQEEESADSYREKKSVGFEETQPQSFPHEVEEHEEVEEEERRGVGIGAESLQKNDNEFKELIFDNLDDILGGPMETMETIETELQEKPFKQTDVTRTEEKDMREEETENKGESLKLTIPLSWTDQCGKTDVKVIKSKLTTREVKRPVMSETHPVRFERLINGESRPKLAQPRPEGYKIKQRSVNTPQDRRSASSKVKVVYIDPLSREEEEKVNQMSVDEIVNYKVGSGLSREGTATPGDLLHRDLDPNHAMVTHDSVEANLRRSRVSSSRGSNRQSRPGSTCSHASERSTGIPSPKLVTVPIHPNAHQDATDLGIISYGARHHPAVNEMPRQARTPGRMSPCKPLTRAGAGQGSSIKSGRDRDPGETEYIKITSQLKVAGLHSDGSRPTTYPGYNFSPRSNTPLTTPRDPDYQLDVYHVDVRATKTDLSDYDNVPEFHSRNITSKGAPNSPVNNDKSSISVKGRRTELALVKGQAEREVSVQPEGNDVDSVRSDSPTPTTVAISIPTADELSDRESPSNSPTRHHDDGLTHKQRRERNLRNQQIGQLTDLIGDAIV